MVGTLAGSRARVVYALGEPRRVKSGASVHCWELAVVMTTPGPRGDPVRDGLAVRLVGAEPAKHPMSALSNRVEGLEVLLSEALSIVRPLGEASAQGDLNSDPWYRVTRLGQRIREALRPAKETTRTT